MYIHSLNRVIRLIRALVPFFGLIIIFVLFHYTNCFVLKYYPVCMNFLCFLIFFVSLFKKETVIQKFAKTINKNITQKELHYTRNLTYVWSVVCFINFLISLLTTFLSDFIWYFYNGCISYIILGLVFGIEYIVRIRFRKRNGI